MNATDIQTKRLRITRFAGWMVESVHRNSLDADVREFVPDEVFETVADARNAVRFLTNCYGRESGPFVYPVLRGKRENIGYVQAVPLKGGGGWEVGYHIAEGHTGRGYATEALTAFLPVILAKLGVSAIWGICRSDNIASRRVLEKSAFVLQQTVTMPYHGAEREICRYLYRAV